MKGVITLEIRHLKTFSVIVKTGSFIQASKLLGYAQPTVTTHIQALEKELNIKLFERLGHNIKITHEGEQLLHYVENILRYSEEAKSALSSPETASGKIVIGANQSFCVDRLPLILKQYLHNFPNVDINLKFGTVNGIHEQLQDNTVDIALFLTKQISFPDLIIENLLPEPVVVVAAPDHPFSAHTSADIRSFENQNLILTQEGCTYRAMIDDLLRKTDTRPKSMIEINNIQAIKQLVMSGLGISILPKVSVESDISQKLLVEIPWTGPILPVFTQIAYHKDKWLSPTLLSFIEQVRISFKSLKC